MAVERKINGVVYRCNKQPASEGLALFLRVTKLFRSAPAMLESIVKNPDEGPSAFLVLCLSGDMDAEETRSLLSDLVGLCSVGNDPCVPGIKPESLKDMVAVAESTNTPC